MNFFQELLRRNVIRMAGLYLVGSWLLVQVASTLFPAFGVPGWALRALAGYYVTGNGAQFNFLMAVVPEYRRIVRGLTPSVASAQVWAKCHSAPAFDQQYLHDCDSPMSETAAQAVLDAYMAEPALLPELRFWMTDLQVSMTLVALSQADTRKLVARLPKDAQP